MLTLGSTQPGQLRLLPSVWAKWGWGKGHAGVQNWAGAERGGRVGGRGKGKLNHCLELFKRHWSVIFSIFLDV